MYNLLLVIVWTVMTVHSMAIVVQHQVDGGIEIAFSYINLNYNYGGPRGFIYLAGTWYSPQYIARDEENLMTLVELRS